jgi:hypothetical protein
MICRRNYETGRCSLIVSSLVLDTVYTDTVAMVLGSLSTTLMQKLDNCLKMGLGLP